MNGIKCISRMEYDLIVSGSLSFFDTFSYSDYSIGAFVYLRCYYTSLVSSSNVDLLVKILDIVSISMNVKSGKHLYRVYFEPV
jgi:hypothetical protein